MSPLDRLIQTARIHGFDVDLTADLITVHLRTETNLLHFWGCTSDPDVTGEAACGDVPVRFTWPERVVPQQRAATA